MRGIFDRLKDIAATGTAILLIEQKAYDALDMAHRAYVMVNGMIRMSGTGKEILANPEVVDACLG